jgi:peptide/nickel transport system permease protein
MSGLEKLKRYPSAFVGLAIILLLVIIAIYAVIAIPYSEAIRLWRGGEGIWDQVPRQALPRWVRLFNDHLPESVIVDSQQGLEKKVEKLSGGVSQVQMKLDFSYPYKDFPSEITLFLKTQYKERSPYIKLVWQKPNGEKVALDGRTAKHLDRYVISLDSKLRQRLGDRPPEVGLFTHSRDDSAVPLQGQYALHVEALLFEAESDIDMKLIVYGKVYGLAGTDHRRRDMAIGLLWGTPIALAFGLIAAIGSIVLTFFISALGSWYGGYVDATIQRITEINVMLPVLPILIMIGLFYSHSIWVMLIAIIVLNIFSLGIKTYRSIFLPLKKAPYIEAACAYGASDLRIIFLYMIPRVIPMLIPAFVMAIPSFVFLEASLAIIGLGDPVLPTWGKILYDGFKNGALYKGYYYWVLQPAILLMLMGLSFAMLGFSLDRLFNPRLRQQ